MNKLSIYIIVVLLLPLAFACSDDEPATPADSSRFDMVTYDGHSGGTSHFLYQGYDDSPIITLVAHNYADTSLRVGQRTMLSYYVTGSPSDDRREINVNYRVSTIFDSLRVAPKTIIEKYDSNPIELKSIWRSGDFINIYTFVQYTDKPRVINMILDERTPDSEVAEAYFIDDIVDAQGYFYRKAYVSIYVGNLWKKHPECKTLRVYVNDLSFPDVKYYEFNRPSNNN